jgi:Tol biopolymer transport system component
VWRFLVVISTAFVVLLSLSMAVMIALGRTTPLDELAFVVSDFESQTAYVQSVDLQTGVIRKIVDAQPDRLNYAWSPDGRYLAYSFNHNGFVLYVVHADGRHPRSLVSSRYWIDWSWSPDSTQIAYSTAVGDINTTELYVLEVETGNQTRLIGKSGSSLLFEDWSPDGEMLTYIRLYYGKERAEASEVWVINADGTQGRRLRYSRCSIHWASWTPDGRLLHQDVNDENECPYSFDATTLIDVTNNTQSRFADGDARPLMWSRDGSQFLFVYERIRFDTYLVIFDYKTRTTQDLELQATSGVWSPDEQRIAFTRLRSAGLTSLNYLFTARADGSGERQVFDFPADNPQWRPVPRED